MSAMKRLFQLMADKKASDIFISVGAPINIKINGNAVPVNQTLMTADSVKQLIYEVLHERQIKEYEDEMELNTAYALEGVGAFRGRGGRDRRGEQRAVDGRIHRPEHQDLRPRDRRSALRPGPGGVGRRSRHFALCGWQIRPVLRGDCKNGGCQDPREDQSERTPQRGLN